MSDAYAHLFADCTACGAQLHWHGRYTEPQGWLDGFGEASCPRGTWHIADQPDPTTR